MVGAVSNTSLAALKARMMSGHAAMIQARPAASTTTTAAAAPTSSTPRPTRASSASTFPRGSVESENVQMATGMAKAARTNIETLNMGVNSYNGAARMLADTDRIEDLRRRGGDKAVDLFINVHQRIQRGSLILMDSSSERMAKEFTVTGVALSRSEDGSYKVGEYVQSASESGWSVSVKSNGQATAIANGIDVSSQVDDSSSSGFRWSALGQTVDIAA